MEKLIGLIHDPAFYGLVVALLALLKAAGEVLDGIGKMIDGPDKYQRAGASIGKLVSWCGKVLKYFAPGHGGFRE